MSDHEELQDVLEEEDVIQDEPNKSLYQQIVQQKELEDLAEEDKRHILSKHLLNIQYFRPDVNILEPTPLEKKIQEMSTAELEKTLLRAQMNSGLYHPNTLSIMVLQMVNAGLQRRGYSISPQLYQNNELLNLVESLIPKQAKKYSEAARISQLLVSGISRVPPPHAPIFIPTADSAQHDTAPDQQSSSEIHPASLQDTNPGQSSIRQDNTSSPIDQ